MTGGNNIFINKNFKLINLSQVVPVSTATTAGLVLATSGADRLTYW